MGNIMSHVDFLYVDFHICVYYEIPVYLLLDEIVLFVM